LLHLALVAPFKPTANDVLQTKRPQSRLSAMRRSPGAQALAACNLYLGGKSLGLVPIGYRNSMSHRSPGPSSRSLLLVSRGARKRRRFRDICAAKAIVDRTASRIKVCLRTSVLQQSTSVVTTVRMLLISAIRIGTGASRKMLREANK
jgi:hypothetical protein